MTTTRTWQTNADEFAALDSGEGWPFATLVACSVNPGEGDGVNKGVTRVTPSKVSAREFAARANTSAPRVLRYLACWERAAAAGVVQPSADLLPEHAGSIAEPDESWLMKNGSLRYGDPEKPSGGRPRDSKPEDAATIIERRGAAAVVETLTDDQRRDVARAALDGLDPATRDEVYDESAGLTRPPRLDAPTPNGSSHAAPEASPDNRLSMEVIAVMSRIQTILTSGDAPGYWSRAEAHSALRRIVTNVEQMLVDEEFDALTGLGS